MSSRKTLEEIMNRKEISVLSCLCILITFMDISGLPGILLKITVVDIDVYIIPLIINFILIGIISWFILKRFHIDFAFGFTKNGLREGLKKYALAGIIAGIFSFVAFFIGLFPFDYKPTIWKVLVEGVIYYIGVSIVEEFYVRGLFLNIIEALFSRSAHKTAIAIVVSSVVFGLGHIPGVIGMDIGVLFFKVVSTIGMGLYFGTIYKKTNNIWVPIILHAFIDICAIPYCFTANMRYENITIFILLIVYIVLGIYSINDLRKNLNRRKINDK